MSYEKGDAYIATMPCSDYDDEGFCSCEPDQSWAHRLCRDWGVGTVALPHSCDEWVIGSKDDVLALISDLKKLIE